MPHGPPISRRGYHELVTPAETGSRLGVFDITLRSAG
jgi:hypothetical protein